jgi:N-ethylmaleimide reductase
MVNNGYDQQMVETAVKEGDDLVAFGKLYIANPDLVARLKQGGPFNAGNQKTWYGGRAEGFTDYPTL